MKKLIIFMIASLFTLVSFGQSGVLRGPGGLWIGNATTLTPVFKIGVTPITTTAAQFNYLNTLTSNVQTQLNDTIDISSVAAPTATIGTNTTQLATTAFVNNASKFLLTAYQAMGSSVIAMGLSCQDLSQTAAATSTLVDGQAKFIAVYVPYDCTITGVGLVMKGSGSYTADNYNGVGLYSYSAGTLTLMASYTNVDGSIWKAAPGSLHIPFSAPYTATAGLYYIALLYNESAQVTPPTIGAGAAISLGLGLLDFTNSNKISGVVATQSVLPTPTINLSGVTNNGEMPVFYLY